MTNKTPLSEGAIVTVDHNGETFTARILGLDSDVNATVWIVRQDNVDVDLFVPRSAMVVA